MDMPEKEPRYGICCRPFLALSILSQATIPALKQFPQVFSVSVINTQHVYFNQHGSGWCLSTHWSMNVPI